MLNSRLLLVALWQFSLYNSATWLAVLAPPPTLLVVPWKNPKKKKKMSKKTRLPNALTSVK
jgi:hypothetical protein